MSIGSGAFSECKSLVSVVIPKNVDIVGQHTFRDCIALTIYCEMDSKPSSWDYVWNYINGNAKQAPVPVVWDYKNNDVADDGYIYTLVDGIRYRIEEGIAKVVYQPQNIVEAIIPAYITYKGTNYDVIEISENAFEAHKNLSSVIIGDNITNIAENAFAACVSLESVAIGKGVRRIDRGAFRNCSPTSVNYFGDIADWCNISFYDGNSNPLSKASQFFIKGEKVTEIVIPEGVTSIDDYAFENFKGLISIVIPNSVTSIGYYAFNECDGLTSVVIPNSVTDISNYAFRGCSNITIYCEAESQPSGWASNWNYSDCPVVWGHKLDE